ncbi:acetyl esterase/lipase [Pedobacter sp. AK017]|uniref:alpha/beta hydrolase n=1 Tax=Pedobacter sp. AK017 TaxID=2723073 RepID=UPI00161A25F9|nr:alpha/beta hydrolase [Pedobacter sp. AK017]MBB5438003.1 acetyl esterase/lipase [Pedobacter sp. AK017]
MKRTFKLTLSVPLTFCLWLLCGVVSAQQLIPLQGEGGPGITAYLPAKGIATGTAVLVIPGGAYAFLATSTEGTPIAKAFAERGIAAFVLKYRLPAEVGVGDKSIGPLQDGQQALRLIRQRAAEFGINAGKVGVIGFSAGGHLAATLATKFGKPVIDASGVNLRPDFAVLVYPVISMTKDLTHMGSRVSLLGAAPSDTLVNAFSAEQLVTINTPPVYLTHTADDGLVKVENSIAMYEALIAKSVDAELHLYPRGDHGFIQRLPVSEWLNPVLLFMKKEGF